MRFKTTNPFSLETLNEYNYVEASSVEGALGRSSHAFVKWRDSKLHVRSQILQKISQLLVERVEILATTMTLEMGKPIKESRAEILKCATVCDYYAENLESFLKTVNLNAHYKTTYIEKVPLGPVFAIMPWNFPFWQVFRFSIPSVAAGNVVILKHSDLTAASAIEIEKLFNEATELYGFKDVLLNLHTDHSTAATVIQDSRVRAVTFTGSCRGGAAVASLAGANLKKSVLELGGNDAYIVLDDVDLKNAVLKCTQARLLNNGQTCIAAKRFVVHQNIYDQFLDSLKEQFSRKIIGNPLEESTHQGPMASLQFKIKLKEQLSKALAMGAKLELGHEKNLEGAFFPPTILSMSKNNMELSKEEFFGPVAQLYKFNEIEEAIHIANATPFGLGGAIFGNDVDACINIGRKLDVGIFTVNDFVKSDPRAPFGGIKDSGYGRELGEIGFNEFLNYKMIGIA